jgi:cellulose synthase/poly-beta-1,6-N-acetylglucosamine synthase-like glycosyltransferase
MLHWIFWLCAVGACYSYIVYPLLLALLPRRGLLARPQLTGRLPRVSLIIACRNETARIREKLDNALAVDYPDLEIIVASDASDDGSDDIVRSYRDRGVRLVRSPERRGKEHAQGHAVAAATGEIIVFSDAATALPRDSIRILVENFAEPRVGAVTSEDTFVSADGQVQGEGAYVRYEMWLRRLESSVYSVVGLSGSYFAARRSLLDPWNDSIPSDFATAIKTIRAGKIAVADPRVRGIYRDVRDPSAEYPRKVRTVLRGISALASMPGVLNPFRYGVVAFEMWGHKLMRWLVPWFALGALASSAALAPDSRFFLFVLLVQLAGYAVVIAAQLMPALRSIGPVRILYYFIQVNVAIAHASLRFLAGHRVTLWQPSVR